MSDQPLDRTSALPSLRFPLPQRTARLSIRAFVPEDEEAIFAIHGDPLATRYMTGPLTREASRANLAALIRRVDETGYGPYAITLLETGEVIGWAGIQQVPGEAFIEVIFAVQADQWGRGYATEASRALLEVCFNEFDMEEVVATVDPDNAASIAVLRKHGFIFDRPFRHKLIDLDGHLYCVTREQFGRACPSHDRA